MGCDLCGRNGQLFQAKVEGTTIQVCDRCAKYGQVLKRIPTAKEQKERAKLLVKEAEARIASPGGAASDTTETLLLVRSDSARLIKQARERLGLKQEELAKRLNLKESQLHKYESGVHQPELETARMLEKALRITLVEEQVIEHGKGGKPTGGPMTIGDFLKVRKR